MKRLQDSIKDIGKGESILSLMKGRYDITVRVDSDVLKTSESVTKGNLVGSIDQGTSSTRFVVFSREGQIVASAQMEHTQIFFQGEDKVGWHEHDPIEIWVNTVSCIDAVVKALKTKGVNLLKMPLKAIGITNQRETTIAWNADTGIPYYNAIVWDDVRTTHIASEVANGNVNRLRDKTGLPLASYFAGTKVKWLLDNIPELRQDLHDDLNRSSVRFGTIDTWLVYQLTGAKSPHDGAENLGGLCLTDVSNASRWLFLDLRAATWDQSLVDTVCAPHQLPLSALPIIRPSSNIYAVLSNKCGIPAFEKVPLASVLGDQQAALFGQACFRPGEAKNTYGTGMFLMMNTGEKMVPSNHGLLTTIGYQIGEDGELVYALEGSVSHSGSTVQWLRDQLGIISTASETETLATESNDGLYFVPAFAGLFAPHWRFDARACIVGMTASHHKGHICRAALEASAYQTREVFDAIYADSDVELLQLKVDGGATANSLLMQFQADMINVEVIRPVVMETTSIGAAFAAGLAVGVWSSTDEIKKLWAVAQVYSPNMEEEQRNRNWQGWQKAIEKSMGWVDDDGHVDCGEAQQSPDVESDLTQKVTEVEEADAEVFPAMQENENKGYSTVAVTAVAFSALMVGIVLGRVKK